MNTNKEKQQDETIKALLGRIATLENFIFRDQTHWNDMGAMFKQSSLRETIDDVVNEDFSISARVTLERG